MKTIWCALVGHRWTEWELLHVYHNKRKQRLSGLFLRWCPRCQNSQWKTVSRPYSVEKS